MKQFPEKEARSYHLRSNVTLGAHSSSGPSELDRGRMAEGGGRAVVALGVAMLMFSVVNATIGYSMLGERGQQNRVRPSAQLSVLRVARLS